MGKEKNDKLSGLFLVYFDVFEVFLNVLCGVIDFWVISFKGLIRG